MNGTGFLAVAFLCFIGYLGNRHLAIEQEMKKIQANEHHPA